MKSFFVFILLISPAYGQCVSHADIMKHLNKKYGEKIVATGVTNSGEFMEFYISRENLGWTMVITTPNGCSKMIESGTSFERAPKAEGTRS